MSYGQLLVIIIGMGIITYLLRLSFFVLQDRVKLPLIFEQTLRYAPAAVILGLVAPSLLMRQGELALSPSNERLIAAIIAGIIAWATKNVLVTIISGMIALWILQALGV